MGWWQVLIWVVIGVGVVAALLALDRLCLENIARYKRPKDYRFVDALPTNNYGKVVKRELRDELRVEAERDRAT